MTERDRYLFKTPTLDQFHNETGRQEYLERCRCALCGKKLQDGDEWEFRALMTPEETGGGCVPAAIVHSRCIDEHID